MSGEGTEHPLPLLLDRVLNSDEGVARAGGWDVEIHDGEIEIGVYDEPPETGGKVKVVGRIPYATAEELAL